MELDKADDITDPNTGEVIVEDDSASTVTHVTLPTPIEVEAVPTRRKTAGKVGRPITSPRTLAASDNKDNSKNMNKIKSKNANKKKRFSSIKTSLARSNWSEKMKLKAERKAIKQRSDEYKARRQQKLEEERRLRAEARKRKEENQRKAEVVQPIKKTAKLKRMKRKEIKKIRKA